MKTCNTCKANKVCNHDKYGFENCGNYIPDEAVERCEKNDYISKSELVENLDRFAPEHLTPLIRTLIDKQPTADFVEVVRCGKCKHWRMVSYDPLFGKTFGRCHNNDFPFMCEERPITNADNFCSYGKRNDFKE